MTYRAVARLDEVPEDEGVCVELDGRRIALFRDGDAVHAIDNVCPHQGAPLAEGFYEDGVVTCPLHAWEFDVRTGRVRGGPERVRTFAARVTADGAVEVSLEEIPAPEAE